MEVSPEAGGVWIPDLPPRQRQGMVQVEKHLTDQELTEIVKRKRQEIKAHREQGNPQAIGERLADTLIHIEKGQRKRAKKARKQYGSNSRKSPDKRFIRIPNDFVETIYKQYLRPNESKVLWFLVRKIWGWGKKSDFIALKQFKKELDIPKEEASRALSSLRKRRIVEQLHNKRYTIQADVSKWQNRRKKKRAK